MEIPAGIQLLALPLVWFGAYGRWRALHRTGVVAGDRGSDLAVTVGFALVTLAAAAAHWRDALFPAAFLPLGLVSAYALGIRRATPEPHALR